MKELPKISIVTPSYNQAAFLPECLSSVSRQGYPNLEQIVVDGGSTDGSVEILREYSSNAGRAHLRWVSEKDEGQSDALNKGFRMATGNVLGWLNSDDFYLPGILATVSRAFQQHPEMDVLYGDYLWTDSSGKPFQIRREITFSRFVLFHTHVNFVQSSGAFFFRRRIIDDGHFLNVKYHYAMDYEYFLRLAWSNYRFQRLPEVLCGLRLHEHSKTGASAPKQFEEHERARREILVRAGLMGRIRGNRLSLWLLRSLADGRRWVEKAIRGHYFTQFHPPTLAQASSAKERGDLVKS
jgi:glycosyltransferase involved in cell wall biosynthesis